MAVKTEDLESELIEALCGLIRDRLPEAEAPMAQSFVRQFYHWVPAADLSGHGEDELYGVAMAQWEVFQTRRPPEVKVRVYNPDEAHNGVRAPHTFIQIVSDDMPFIVDSVTMELARQGCTIDLVIHPVIRVRRDEEGRLVEVLEPDAPVDQGTAESVLHAEVAREHEADRLGELSRSMCRVLEEVTAAVTDWQAMRGRMLELAEQLAPVADSGDGVDVQEAREFLRWTADDNFIFLGYREYELDDHGQDTALQVRPESGLGILRAAPATPRKLLSPKAAAMARGAQPLVLTKANSLATVHRPARLDYIGVKRFTPDGRVTGEYRFLGLYTTAAYRARAGRTPLVRDKVEYVLDRAAFPPASHDAKALLEILESYPRDALFQLPAPDLFEIAMGLLGLGERPRLRLFVWRDPLDRFVACLVTIPRDRFNTENRERVGRILLEAFAGHQLDHTLQLSESLLVRVHYIVRCPEGVPEIDDLPALEARLARSIRAWTDDLKDALQAEHGVERAAALFARYEQAFPPTYRSERDAASAVADIARLEELAGTRRPMISLYRSGSEGSIRCKLYSSDQVALSDVLPTFEHMGARVIDERPYRIAVSDSREAWIYDFGLRCPAEHVESVREVFQDVFLGAMTGALEDDRLNGLVLVAALPGREIMILRAAARYLRQAGIPYSDAYMERTLLAHPDIARLLVKLFLARFDPDHPDPELAGQLGRAMEMAIDSVKSLDEDRILRSFLAVVRAALRTNYFRQDTYGAPLPYFSVKLDPVQIPVLPKPRPKFEIYVYAPRFEGVHLRGGKVARGGLRWSDRPEDFRTEILGLMKAQMVKNALIVPVGAKGGFVLKRPPGPGGPELREEAVACYEMFLSGLLDLTDNIVDGEVIVPPRVVRYDDDDPYLVVAADKGTAAFSDIANGIAARYEFWLGDAFASGGSHGYDHKEMGITARGAWESVKRHFRELGTDVQATEITAVGIGDMAGDVFGNGMLCSPHIRLLAAFNHSHVFLDPDPDAQSSFAERRRLFEVDRSIWTDYDPDLISPGGGVYERSAKSIPVSEQVRRALAIEADELAPADLIREILRAPVDLLWNGGIGTYVKAAGESHPEVGDKSNDGLRVDGRELRCRVVGEGGNLGFTQLGRIEYALRGGPEGDGGHINTDAIDNVAGVNCSDHEVNIKILLDAGVRGGRLGEAERNELLVQMTDAVADHVLHGSYTQTQAISLARAQAGPMIDVHRRMIRRLEQVAGLDRELEFLPSEDVISDRKAVQQGLTAPELAVLMAYCKIYLFARLLDSDLPEDEHLFGDLERYFPPPLRGSCADLMHGHRLRREIIATVVANQLVDRAGTTFAFRLGEETGAPPARLARGYAVAREVFDMRSFWEGVESLDNQVQAAIQLEMLIEARRLVERSTRWLVRVEAETIDIAATARMYAPGVELLRSALPGLLDGSDREAFDTREAELREAGVPVALARRVAAMPSMSFVFDIASIASSTGRALKDAMTTYFRLGAQLELNWLRDRIVELPRANRWQALARSALREDLLWLHSELASQVLECGPATGSSDGAIERWSSGRSAAVERWLATLADIRASRSYDMTTLPVALREVRRLIHDGEDRGQLTVTERL
ncbi:MAG: NAD-glutamate dehydrogenase [Solirubrobacteraceae bacterium]